jgi:Tol biopolymer transport system component
LLFNDESPAAGLNYRVCLRTTNGGPVVVLGEGEAYGFSPDGKWALATIDTPPQLVIYPTGPGETRHLPRGDLEAYHWASWFPDGKSVLVSGNEPGKASRCYQQDLSGGLPRPVTPEGTTNGTVSPDGLQILYLTPAGSYFVQDARSGTAQPVPGVIHGSFSGGDCVMGWSANSRSLFIFRGSDLPFRIERLDLDSGHRVLVREVGPADRGGVLSGGPADLTEDAKYYAYNIGRMPSQLFVVEGVR